MYQFRFHKTTIAKIISGICKAIYKVLMPIYVKVQKQESGLLEISDKSFERSNFPHYFVAEDGKHIDQCITVRPSLSISVRLCTCCTFFIYPKTN